MSIIARLTLRHLSENRKRTVVTILGIAIATALISAILMGVFSFFKFFGYLATETDGNVHAAYYEVTEEQAKALKADDRIEIAGVADNDPKISGVKLGGGAVDGAADANVVDQGGALVGTTNASTANQGGGTVDAVSSASTVNQGGTANTSIANQDDATLAGAASLDGTATEDWLRTGNIFHADRDFYTAMVLADYEGTLPENADEIAVEAQFLADNGLSKQVGDTLTFAQGYRYFYEDGELVYLAGNYRSEEYFDLVSVETCKITAILHGNRPTSGFDVLRGMDEGDFPAQKYAEVRVALKNCDHTGIRQVKEIAEEYGIGKYDYNTEYMLSVFAFEGGAGSYRAFFVLMAIGLLIVIVTSVVLIVNSLGMSLAERMRYLGMLASVGATGRQKRFSIYFEGVVLGAIGIPLGLLLGYIGTKVTLSVLGRKVLEAEVFSGAEGMRGEIPISCSVWVILAIVGFAGVTILASTLFPALKAAKVMPIDALRQNTVIRASAKSLRVNPLVRRLCGYEGELAYKNIKRNGIKGTVITISIAVSVILFLTISFFCDSVKRANDLDFDMPCQVMASCAYSEGEKLRGELEAMDDVERVFGGGMIQFLFEKSEGEDYTLANKDIADPKYLTDAYSGLKLDGMAVVIVDDGEFEGLLERNGLSREKYYGGAAQDVGVCGALQDADVGGAAQAGDNGGVLRGVLLNNFFRDKKGDEVFNEGILGQKLHYDEVEGFPPAIEIGDFIEYDEESSILKLTPKGTMTVYVPASMYYEKAKETIPEDTLTVDLCVVTKRHEEVCQAIYELFEREGYHNYSCSDMASYLAAVNTVTLLLETAMFGFTIMLTLVAIANIVNTISTGVLMRRKEFAMYRSVGMTSGGFRKMIRLETLLYGVRALLFGLPVSLLLSYLMYRSFDEKLYTFDPNWVMYVAVTAAVFAVVGLSMLLSLNKIKDDSIIEALKEDAV